jgi:hypothetical protein
VAAEERRRIVPVELRPAELTGGIRYELAGIQQISFAERDFECRSRAHQRVGRARRRGDQLGACSTRWTALSAAARRRRVVLVAAVGLFLATRAGDGEDAAGTGDAVVADPSLPAGSTKTSTATTTIELESAVWFARFRIDTDGAEHDPTQRTVAVSTTFTNEQPAAANPLNVILGDVTALECECDSLAPGASARTVLTFAVDEGFDLADAILVFGGPRQHQAKVPLDGRPAGGPGPVVQSVSGVVDDGAGTTFSVDRVEVLAATCSGLSSSLTYGPAPSDEYSVEVWGTALTTAPSPGGVGFGEAYLVLPDGTKAGSSSLDGYIHVLGTDQPQRDIPVCFTVAGPISGEYRFIATAVGVEPDPEGLALRF